MTNLICLDRDGTINRDDNYYLGSSLHWKEQVEILEGVIEGIKVLNSIPDAEVFILTNQSGVALANPQWSELTEKRMHEVNEYIVSLLSKEGCKIKGYFACPFVDNAYVKKYESKGRIFHQQYIIDNHPDLKPRIGMIQKAAKSIGKNLSECTFFVIGDRKSDVEMGLNAEGYGVLVASNKTEEGSDKEFVTKLSTNNKRVYCARSFIDATQFIQKKITDS